MKFLPLNRPSPSQKLLFFGYTPLDTSLAVIAFAIVSWLTPRVYSGWYGLVSSLVLGLFAARVAVGCPPLPRPAGRPAKASATGPESYDKYYSRVIDKHRIAGATGGGEAKSGLHVENVPSEVDVLIVGASSLGLSSAAILKHKFGMDSKSLVVLDKNRFPGDTWRNRYDRVTLHDVSEVTLMPFLRIPDKFPVWIDHRDFADYQDEYADKLGLQSHLHMGCEVIRAEEIGNRYRIEYKDSLDGQVKFVSARVVMKCVGDSTPAIPEFEGKSTFPGVIVHSSQFKNALEFARKRVIVLGFGKSGSEIALDLWEHNCKVDIVSRGVVAHVPRHAVEYVQNIGIRYPWVKFLYPLDFLLSNLALMIWTWFDWGNLSAFNVRQQPLGPRMQAVRASRAGMRRGPCVDVGTIDLIRANKIQVHDATIEKIEDSLVTLSTGVQLNCDAIVFASGFIPTKIPGLNSPQKKGPPPAMDSNKPLTVSIAGNIYWGIRACHLNCVHVARGLGLKQQTWDFNPEMWTLCVVLSGSLWLSSMFLLHSWTDPSRLVIFCFGILMNAYCLVIGEPHWMFP